MSVHEDFDNWMSRTRSAAMRHCMDEDGLYAGVTGAKRFARECGPAIADFGEYGEKHITSTYSGICVIAYNLRPPIDAATWLGEVRRGFEKALEVYGKAVRKTD